MNTNFFAKTFSAVFVASCILSATAVGANAAVYEKKSVSTELNENPAFDMTDSFEDVPPISYSSLDLGFTPPVRRQLYNDCWAYASMTAFESKLLHDGFTFESYSPQQINQWATTRPDGTGWQRKIINDAYAETSLGYFISWQNIEHGKKNPQLMPENGYSFTDFGATSIRFLDHSDKDSIKKAIMENGSVYSAYSQSTEYENLGRISYYCPEGMPLAQGHAITIVGWDDDYSKHLFKPVNGKIPENNGAWLVQNSWGKYNLLGGFFWISYEDAYLLSNTFAPAYTFESYEVVDENKKLYQNEIYGATYEFTYLDDKEMTYLNMFNFSDGYNELDSVIFETTYAVGADYEIYYVPVENNTPVSDESRWTLLKTDVVPFDGYICADIESYELPVGYGAIAVRIDNTINSYRASIGVDEWLQKSDGSKVFIGNSDYNQSFIYLDGKMVDLKKWYEEVNSDPIGGTFVIKAVTNKTEAKVTILGDVNLDTITDVRDVTYMQQYLAGYFDITEVQKLNFDVDRNGTLDVNDVTYMQMMLAGYDIFGEDA